MKKRITIFYTTWILIFVLLMMILTNTKENTIVYNIFNPILGITFISLPLSIVAFVLTGENNKRKRKQEEFNKLPEEEKLRYYKQKELEQSKIIDAKLKRKQELQILKDNIRKSTTISKVMIVGTNSKTITDSNDSLIGGLVGGALFGLVGAIAGATSGDKKTINYTIFLIEYSDGRRINKTVKNNSAEFKRLCQYLKM